MNQATLALAVLSLAHSVQAAPIIAGVSLLVPRTSTLSKRQLWPTACDPTCGALNTNLHSCTSTSDTVCICNAFALNDAGQLCINCLAENGLTSGDTYQALEAVLQGCPKAAPVSSANPSASGAAPPSANTALSGADLTVQMWQPSGYSQPILYEVESTGGVNTTLHAVETLTVTDSLGSPITTATLQEVYVAAPTKLAYAAIVDEYADVVICSIGSDNEAACREVQFSGSVGTATTEFSLSGSTVPVLADYNTPSATATASSTL